MHYLLCLIPIDTAKCSNLVREAGLEPARQRRQDLNLVRLPISPLALPEGKSNSIGNR